MIISKNRLSTIILLWIILLLSTDYATAETDSYEVYTNNPDFIASRGTFADSIDQEWKNAIVDCWTYLQDSPFYYKFDKAINSIACNNEFLIIDLNSEYGEEINDSRIDLMYQKIEAYCEENTGLHGVPIVFMWADNSEKLEILYNPYAFEKAKNNTDFIVAMGIVPIFADENEWLEWSEEIHEARYIKGLETYLSSSPVILYDFIETGSYIEVGVNKKTPEKVNSTVINEIYQIIDTHYEQQGINNIPVVFIWAEPYIWTKSNDSGEYVTLEWMEECRSNSSINGEIGDNKTTKAPGFTSLSQIVCMLLLVKTRKHWFKHH
nr:hypothetical protein [uncultured Methanolobus sp.]